MIRGSMQWMVRNQGEVQRYETSVLGLAVRLDVVPEVKGLAGASLLLVPATSELAVAAGVPFLGAAELSMRPDLWAAASDEALGSGATAPGVTEASVWASRGGVAWRALVGPMKRHGGGRGSARWADLVLGEVTMRHHVHEPSEVTVDLAEGEYTLSVRHSVTLFLRRRVPWPVRVVTSTTVFSKVGIPVPDEGNAEDPSREHLKHYHSHHGLDADRAVRCFVDGIRRVRRELGGSFWIPALRVRAVGSADAEGAQAWESRDPTTGEWSPWRTCRRDQLPHGYVEGEPDSPLASAASALLRSLVSRVATRGVGDLGSVLLSVAREAGTGGEREHA